MGSWMELILSCREFQSSGHWPALQERPAENMQWLRSWNEPWQTLIFKKCHFLNGSSCCIIPFFLIALIDDVNWSPQLHVSKGMGDFERDVNKDHESSKTFNAQQITEDITQSKISSGWRWGKEKSSKVRILWVSTVLQKYLASSKYSAAIRDYSHPLYF